MPLRFTTELKPVHVRAATARIFRRQITRPVVLGGTVFVFVAAQAIFWAAAPAFNWEWHTILGVLMIVLVAGTVAFADRHFQDLALRNFQRFKGCPVQVRLEDDRYCYEAQWGKGELEWSRFQSLWCLPEVWVLLQHAPNGLSVLLPAEDLDEEAKTFLKERMRAAGARLESR